MTDLHISVSESVDPSHIVDTHIYLHIIYV